MGTRSTIGIMEKNGKINMIYCHFDGFLYHNGKILNSIFNKVGKVRKLIDMGSIVSLKDTLEKMEKSDVDTCSCVGIEEYLKSPILEGYNYLFDVENKIWLVNQLEHKTKLYPLESFQNNGKWMDWEEVEKVVEKIQLEEDMKSTIDGIKSVKKNKI